MQNAQHYMQACLVGAAIMLLIGVALTIPAVVRRYRSPGLAWDDGLPLSAVGYSAWALNAYAWGATLLFEGLPVESMKPYNLRILGCAFALLFLAGFGDAISQWIRKR